MIYFVRRAQYICKFVIEFHNCKFVMACYLLLVYQGFVSHCIFHMNCFLLHVCCSMFVMARSCWCNCQSMRLGMIVKASSSWLAVHVMFAIAFLTWNVCFTCLSWSVCHCIHVLAYVRTCLQWCVCQGIWLLFNHYSMFVKECLSLFVYHEIFSWHVWKFT